MSSVPICSICTRGKHTILCWDKRCYPTVINTEYEYNIDRQMKCWTIPVPIPALANVYSKELALVEEQIALHIET